MGKKILIVDDEEKSLKLMSALLRNYGYMFETAKNGIEALEKSKEFSPDLIFLDIMMPEMDGYEVCRRLKNDPLTEHIPVVMVTVLQDKESHIKGLEVGAIDFLTKPVDSTELMVKTKNLLKVKEFGDFLKQHNELLDSEVKKRTMELQYTLDELRESEEKYRSLFVNMLNGFAYNQIVVDVNNKPVDYVFIEINDAFERYTGLKKKDIIGKKVTEVFPEIKELKPDLIRIYGDVALTGRETKFELYFETLKQWFTISVYSPQRGYFVTLFDNITEKKRAEEEIKKRIEELEDFYEMAIGRELRMKELKDEIEELKEELSKYKKDEKMEKI
jgi:PAS domain S-box-containing protein